MMIQHYHIKSHNGIHIINIIISQPVNFLNF